jgi:hypothetical protein
VPNTTVEYPTALGPTLWHARRGHQRDTNNVSYLLSRIDNGPGVSLGGQKNAVVHGLDAVQADIPEPHRRECHEP